MENVKLINTRLLEDFNYVTSLGYNVLGVFLQGSQNYQLDYPGSDIDTKAIIIPSFIDFVLNINILTQNMKQSINQCLIIMKGLHIITIMPQ